MSIVDELIAALPQQETAQQEAGQAEMAAAEQQAPTEASTQDGAEMAAAETGAESQETQQGQPAEPAQETQPPAQTQEFNWDSFRERSNGLITDEASFLSAVEKAAKYDEVSKAKDELEKGQFKAANPYIDTLNRITLEGASKDQVKAFMRLNEYGNLDELSTKDLLVAHKVLIGNYSEDVAKYKVDQEYDLSGFEEGDIEKKVLEDDMRVAASKAKQDLASYRTELTTVNNPEKEAAEQQRLEEIAKKSQYEQLVKAEAPRLAAAVDTKIVLPATKDAGELEVNFSDDFKASIPGIVTEFLNATGLDPRDPNTQEQVRGYAEVRYIAENRDRFLADIRNRVESDLTERLANKNQTKQGLPPEQQNPAAKSTTEDINDFYLSMVEKPRG